MTDLLRALSGAVCMLLFFPALSAQSFSPDEHRCGAEAVRAVRYAAHPAYRALDERLEAQWAKHAARPRRSSPPPYTLPVVFHIMHNGGPENISDADVLRSLDFTNQAMANTDYYDQGTGVATGIQLCLARRTPDNQPTTGITRTVAPDYVDLEATAEDRDMKDLARWDPREYVNVYVVREICGLGIGCGVAGYAYYPGAHGGAVDGIVVEARWLTNNEAAASVLVHELGHYLGLRHTFDGGCVNDDCTRDGDRVCDTPPDQSKVAVPCGGSVNSCTTDTDSGFATDQDDMFINYMDYGYWACYSAFTAGQRDRMYFFLEGIRGSLLESPGCLEPCPAPVTADFTEGDVTVEVGTMLTFTNTSTNGTVYDWRVDGTSEASSTDFTRLFDTEGDYVVTLYAEGNPPLCRPDSVRRRVRVVCSVVAAFDTPGTLLVGEARTFVNQSAGGVTYTWEVNGTPAGAAADLTYTFPTPGLYEICLTAASDWCERSRCRLVFAGAPPDTTGTGDPGCNASFAFAYQRPGDQSTLGIFTAVVADGAGGYFVGGQINRNPIVAYLAPDGSVIWHATLFPEGSNGVIQELILDEEGQLAGIGTAALGGQQQSNEHNFIFRINPTDGSIRWARQYLSEQAGVTFGTILHPDGTLPYTLFGTVNAVNPTAVGFGGVFLQLSPADGSVVGTPVLFPATSIASFERAVFDEVGRFFRVVGYGPINNTFPNEVTLTTLEETGSVVSVQSLPGTSGVTGTLDIVNDNEGFTVLTGTPGTATAVQPVRLYRFGADGSPRLATDYYAGGPLYVRDLAFGPAGYALLTTFSGGAPLVTQLDPGGNFVWSRLVQTNVDAGSSSQTLLAEGDGGMTVGAQVVSFSLGQLPQLLKFRTDGTIEGDCLPGESTFLDTDNVEFGLQQRQTIATPLEFFTVDFFQEPLGLEFVGGSCREPCPTDSTEICDNLIDDDGDGLIDCKDPDVANDCCCLGGPARPLGNDTVYCPPAVINLNLPTGTRVIFTAADGTTGDTLAGLQQWSLAEAGVYTWRYVDSCGRTAVDTLTLDPRPRPLLDLGPDTTLCSNAVIPLLAQPGFATYEWTDGTDTRSFTAFDAGTYWVVATDSCGGVQTDTVRVRIDPVTEIDLGNDTLICPGDTLTFSLTGFSDYQWSGSSFIDCTNCSAVRFAPTTDTLLLVAANRGPACFASDSIRVGVASTAGISRFAALCTGDTLRIGNQFVTIPGSYLDTLPVGDCFRVDTVSVVGLSDTTIRDTLTICAGDSALVFDRFETAAGDYRRSFPRSNGCDSLVEINLAVTGSFYRADTVLLCVGDSVVVFGEVVTAPGTFTDRQTTAAGCDSTLVVEVIATDLFATGEVLQQDCGGAAAGAGRVTVSGGQPPYAYAWNSGQTTARVDTLAAGVYVVSVTDATGCTDTVQFTITDRQPPEVTLTVTPETCPDEADGSLVVTGELDGLLFALDGAAFGTTPLFPNLSPGNYRLLVRDSLGCTRPFDFSIGAAVTFFVDLPDEVTLRLGDSVVLIPTTNAPAADGLLWYIDGALVCNSCPTLTLRPEATATVLVSLADTTGCQVGDETLVRVITDDLFYVPSAFSPNGDGVNDRFRIFPGPAITDVLRLAVYDRWGGEVFLRESFDPTDELNGWDGTRPGGRNPAVGVYVYQAEVRLFTGRVVKRSGEVLVIR